MWKGLIIILLPTLVHGKCIVEPDYDDALPPVEVPEGCDYPIPTSRPLTIFNVAKINRCPSGYNWTSGICSPSDKQKIKKSFTFGVLLAVLINSQVIVCVTLEEQFIKFSQIRQKRQLTYPVGSSIGMYLAFAIPLDLPEQDVLFSYNFEANYNLPNTLEHYSLNSLNGRRTLRSINRTSAFQFIETFLNRKGLEGRSCLSRTICEVRQSHLSHNGVLGNLMNVIFSPSSTISEEIADDYTLAEENGEANRNCEELYSECKYSLLDMITEFDS